MTGTAAGPSSESILSYEKVFRLAFQEVAVEQAPEDVCSLDHFLERSNEGAASVPRLCSESRKLWRALQNTDTVSASRCLWGESHCRENLLPVLGVDAAQKSPLEARVMSWKVLTSENLKSCWPSAVSTCTTAKP